MHTVQETLAAIARHAGALPSRVVVLEQALGLELSEPILMDIDSPPFDRAMLDGYAARAVDALGGAQLEIVGRVDAGSTGGNLNVGQGQCVAINTGAPIPTGADTVVQVEHTAAVAGQPRFVQVVKGAARGVGIQQRGSDARAGTTVLTAGVRLGPAELAVAAAAGRGTVLVRPRPVVGVLTTGDELVPVEATPGPAQIRNTNRVLIRGALQERRLPILDLGTVGDDELALRAALERGLAEADVLIVTGGMSMGTKDLVPKLLADLGVKILVEKVKMKPGKPFVFGTVERAGQQRYVAGLPGNPVSTYVCFVRFVVPLLGALASEIEGPPRELQPAVLEADVVANGDREFYQPCVLRRGSTGVTALPLDWKGSADLFTLARADGLIVHPAGAGVRKAGGMVEILRLR